MGDSGGPAFVRTLGYWRLHGVVSYGTSESEYGDVTVYTRLASHYDWLISELPIGRIRKFLRDRGGWKTRGLVHLFPIRVPGVFISILDGFTFLFQKVTHFGHGVIWSSSGYGYQIKHTRLFTATLPAIRHRMYVLLDSLPIDSGLQLFFD